MNCGINIQSFRENIDFAGLQNRVQTNWQGRKVQVLLGAGIAGLGLAMSAAAVTTVSVATSLFGLGIMAHGLLATVTPKPAKDTNNPSPSTDKKDEVSPPSNDENKASPSADIQDEIPSPIQQQQTSRNANLIERCLMINDLINNSIRSKREETPLRFEGLHKKALIEKGEGYPDRLVVPEDKVAWNQEWPGYAPEDFTSNAVLENRELPQGHKNRWADLPWDELTEKQQLERTKSFQDGALLDPVTLRPLNPCGRTGLKGQGRLGKWGRNQAGDPIPTLVDPNTVELKLLVIKRKYDKVWALAGGMKDPSEQIKDTAIRELQEESGLEINKDSIPARMIYQGYVDDPRNTDNSWMETSVFHYHLDGSLVKQDRLQANDDAIDAQWMPITKELTKNLYASHPLFVEMTLREIGNEALELCANKEDLLAIVQGDY